MINTIMVNIDIDKSNTIEFSELKVVGMGSDYNKMLFKLIVL